MERLLLMLGVKPSKIASLGRGILLGLPVALVTCLILLAAYQVPYLYTFDLKNPEDSFFVAGFEPVDAESLEFQWTTANSSLAFPALVQNQNYQLRFRAATGPRPASESPTEVVLYVDGLPIKTIQAAKELRTFSVDIEQQDFAGKPDLVFRIWAPTFVPSETIPGSSDSRSLGVVADHFELEPIGAPIGLLALPPLNQWLGWLLAAGLIFALTFTACGGQNPFVFWGIPLAAIGLLSAGLIFARPWVAVSVWYVCAALAIGSALALTAPVWSAAVRSTSRTVFALLYPFKSRLSYGESIPWTHKPNSRPFAEAGLMIMTAAAATLFAKNVWIIFTTSPFTDFDILFHSALSLADGQSPYDVNGLRQAPFGPYYKFPPLVDLVLSRFAVFHLKAIEFARIYAGVGLLLYLLTFFLLVKMESIQFRTFSFYFLAIGFLSFQPSLDTLYGSQHEFVILALFTLSYWGITHKGLGEWIAGACIAVAAMIKIYPGLLLVYFILRRSWNAAFSFLTSATALMLISTVWAGLEISKQFWFEVFPALSGGTPALENQSFFGFFARLFVNGAAVNPALAAHLTATTFLTNAATVLALALSFGLLLRISGLRFAFPILVPLMLLISPNSWIHYETLLLLPLAILLSRLTEKADLWEWLLLLLAVILVAYGNEDTIRQTTLGLVQSYKFFGVLLFWVIGIERAWRTPAQEHSRDKILMQVAPVTR